MRYVLLLLLTSQHLFACVTYDRSTGTYTVDPSGCVGVETDDALYEEMQEILQR